MNATRPPERTSSFDGVPDPGEPVDGEVPPVVACGRCGDPACGGCSDDVALVGQAEGESPPWEHESLAFGFGFRLWQTALESAVLPERAFGAWMKPSTILPALTFAFVCEFLAVGSLVLPLSVLVGLVVPRALFELISSPDAWAAWGVVSIAGATGMVMLHAVWGLLLEWSLSRDGRPANHRSGLRFGLYACGWDLITSPIGVLVSLFSNGPRETWELFRTAARVPRRAMTNYLGQARAVAPGDQAAILRRAAGVAIALFGTLFLALGGLTVAWVLRQVLVV